MKSLKSYIGYFYLLWIFIITRDIMAQKQPYFIGNRTTMVHLFEWTWPAIAKECEDFLGPRGYGGVQISPPNEARIITTPAHRPWWERYQPVSYLLTSRSGTETQLREMIERCNRAGIRIYVDVVLNHMTGAQAGESLGSAGSAGYYDARKYPAVPYGPNDFNAPCAIRDYSNPLEVRNCQLSSLLDLNQSKPHVRAMIVSYMNKLIDMGVAGFRIDAAKHMWPVDLMAIYGELHDLKRELGFPKGARPHLLQEVIDLGGETIRKTDYNHLGDVTEFKYSTEIGRVFRGHNDLKWLVNWGSHWGFLPSNDALVFVDNHDNQRGHGAGGADILTHKDGDIYKMALIFMLAHPYGEVARVMSSYKFNDTDQGPPTTSDDKISAPTILPNGQCDTATSNWVCEHRWPDIANMVEFRNVVGNTSLEHWWDNGRNQLAFSRVRRGFVAINMESAQEMRVTLQTGLPMGIYCNILDVEQTKKMDSCIGRQLTVGSDGKLNVSLPKGPSALAIHLSSKVANLPVPPSSIISTNGLKKN